MSGPATLSIQVNGEPGKIPPGGTVADLLAQLGLQPGTVAVELNRRILRRAELAETALAEGDRLELVRFVSGGGGSAAVVDLGKAPSIDWSLRGGR